MRGMRVRTCSVAIAIVLLSATLSAQDGLRSALLPDRPLTSALAAEREDLFRATADTYRPDPNRLMLPWVAWPGLPQVVYVPQYVQVVIPSVIQSYVRRPARSGPAERYVPGTPGRPKTFYVIPGCYGGDRRPTAASLAPGCDLSDLRVIAP